MNGLFLLGFRSLLDQVHELLELRSDDDLGATIALLAQLCGVVGHGIILSAPTGCKPLGCYPEAILQILHTDDARKADKSQLFRIFFIEGASVLIGTLSVFPSIKTS